LCDSISNTLENAVPSHVISTLQQYKSNQIAVELGQLLSRNKNRSNESKTERCFPNGMLSTRDLLPCSIDPLGSNRMRPQLVALKDLIVSYYGHPYLFPNIGTGITF
jgi:hypothetical protein